MLITRFRDVKAAVARAVNVGVTDTTRLLDYVNRATERILYDGKWKGTTQTFRLCLTADACIVWPREIETIEAIAACDSPLPIRNEWYEFSQNGYGVIPCDDTCRPLLVDRGEVCCFDQPIGENKKLAVFCDKQEETEKYITVQYYDSGGQWVRTEFNGEWIDGEKLALPAPGSYTYSSRVCKPGGLMHVIKDVTAGIVRLYSYETTTTILKPLGYYQPDEEVPVYRRSSLPALAGASCEQQKVSVVAKLRFIPATVDDSLLLISHREAIRLACKAVYEEENDRWPEANINWGACYRALDAQLNHYLGSGTRMTINVESPDTWGAGQCNVM